MAIKFQYNKTSLNELNKQLKVRLRALPTLKNKESALRVEVKKARDKAAELDSLFQAKTEEMTKFSRLWTEFDPTLVTIREVEFETRKIAGVKIPIMGNIQFSYRDFSLFNRPQWYFEGID